MDENPIYRPPVCLPTPFLFSESLAKRLPLLQDNRVRPGLRSPRYGPFTVCHRYVRHLGRGHRARLVALTAVSYFLWPVVTAVELLSSCFFQLRRRLLEGVILRCNAKCRLPLICVCVRFFLRTIPAYYPVRASFVWHLPLPAFAAPRPSRAAYVQTCSQGGERDRGLDGGPPPLAADHVDQGELVANTCSTYCCDASKRGSLRLHTTRSALSFGNRFTFFGLKIICCVLST